MTICLCCVVLLWLDGLGVYLWISGLVCFVGCRRGFGFVWVSAHIGCCFCYWVGVLYFAFGGVVAMLRVLWLLLLMTYFGFVGWWVVGIVGAWIGYCVF